jgi:hypothetical protein
MACGRQRSSGAATSAVIHRNGTTITTIAICGPDEDIPELNASKIGCMEKVESTNPNAVWAKPALQCQDVITISRHKRRNATATMLNSFGGASVMMLLSAMSVSRLPDPSRRALQAAYVERSSELRLHSVIRFGEVGRPWTRTTIHECAFLNCRLSWTGDYPSLNQPVV